MATIINKTPHSVSILDHEGRLVKTFDSEGYIRLATKIVRDLPIEDIPTTRTEFGQPEGLPVYTDGVFYIVSQMVKNALPERNDLLVPAELMRNDKGMIIGCKSLGR